VAARSADALGRVGFGPWPVAAALVAAGLVALWRLRLPAVATAACLLAGALLVGAGTQRYRLLDERTSSFFTTLLTVLAALGIVAVVAWSARRATLPLGIAIAVGAGAPLVPTAHAEAMHPMPPSTLRQQAAFVLARRLPGDAVVVWPGRILRLRLLLAGAAHLRRHHRPRRPCCFRPSTQAPRPRTGAPQTAGPDPWRPARGGGPIELRPYLARAR
jgi:hypothetical protein